MENPGGDVGLLVSLLFVGAMWFSLGFIPVYGWGGVRGGMRSLVGLVFAVGIAVLLVAAVFGPIWEATVRSSPLAKASLEVATLGICAALGGWLWGYWMGGRRFAKNASLQFGQWLGAGVLVGILLRDFAGVLAAAEGAMPIITMYVFSSLAFAGVSSRHGTFLSESGT